MSIVLECQCGRGMCACAQVQTVHMRVRLCMACLCVDLYLQSFHTAIPDRKSGLREHCMGEGYVQQGVDLEADTSGLTSQLCDYGKGLLIPIPPSWGVKYDDAGCDIQGATRKPESTDYLNRGN